MRIYDDWELAELRRQYPDSLSAEMVDAATCLRDVRSLIRSALVFVRQRDEARAACVRLANRAPTRNASASEELATARAELTLAVKEPHGPDVDHVIDAVLALTAYVEQRLEPKEGA